MVSQDIAQTRAEWDRIAPGYDRTNTRTQMALGAEALRRAGLSPGMRFLDVASGSGALSVPAARIGASVVAVDLSPVMLTLLQERAHREGLAIETQVMDGHALAIDDDSFDVAGSQFGVMLFPDMPRGVHELARVARRGGRVLMVAYGDPHAIDFLTFLIRGIQAVRPDFTGPPADPVPLPFQLQDPARLHRELVDAGLTEVTVSTVTEATEFQDGAELWDWVIWSNPIAPALIDGLELTSVEREAVIDRLETLIRARAGGSGPATLTNPVHIGIGTK